MLFANILGGVGGLLLLAAYTVVTVLSKERVSMLLGLLGSLLMCASFWLLGSLSFFFFNIVWVVLSLLGFLNRSQQSMSLSLDKRFVGLIVLVPNVLAAVLVISFFVVNKDDWLLEMSSWSIIVGFVLNYFMFALSAQTRFSYVAYSLMGSVVSLPYLYSISAYSSLVHTALTVGLSIYGLSSERKNSEN